MNRHTRRLAQCLFLAMCTVSEPASSQNARLRDSAGVRIAENASRLNAPIAFVLGPKPNVDIGGLDADPDKELNAKNGYPMAIRLANGSVVVNDRTRIQFFDAAGKRLHMSGREGGGPGEFGNINAICRTRGDTVLVSDGMRRRVSVFSKTGEYRTLFTLPVGNYAEGNFCLNDGTIFTNGNFGKTATGERTIQINRVNRAGATMNRIADVSTGIFDMAVRRDPSIVSWGMNIAFGRALEHEVQVFSPDGKLAAIIRNSDKLEPVSRSDIEKLPPTAVRANASDAERRDNARRIAAASSTKTWPTYGRLLVDLSGRLWMQDWKQSEVALEPDAWTAFDADGKLIGRLVIPAADSKERRQYVVHFGKDEVFIRRFDDDGAIHYTAYPLLKK